MMSTKNRWVRVAKTGLVCALALILHGNVQAADSTVPLLWNVGPMRSGAYLEPFDSLPAWASAVGYNVLSNDFPAMTGLPVRSNVWFNVPNTQVLQLETAGDVVTNSFLHSDSSPVSFSSEPVYVDLRMKFDPLIDAPDAELLTNVKMALFLSADAHLVVCHAGGISTNAAVLDTNKWYQVTVKLFNGKFDVLTNDVAVFSDLTVRGGGVANTLTSANFYGTGLIDELYVSHGNPAYAVEGPTNAIPDLPVDGSNPPTTEEQTRINAWLNSYPTVTTLDVTQDELSMAYLLNALKVDDAGVATLPGYGFGISNINMISPTTLRITAKLEVESVLKDEPINGKIQLMGKVAMVDDWTTLAGAITPTSADFTGGFATYTFTIPAGGYKFIKALIVAP